jgi:outer membrane lipoprotein-sorting protein
MKLRSVIIVIFILGMFRQGQSQTAFAEMKNIASFRQSFAESTKKTQTLQADFIQEKQLSILSEKIISKGKFMFHKEKMLRWEYTEPFRYLIILNNGMMYVQDEDKKSKTDISSNKVFSEINGIILGCVQGNLFNDESKFRPAFFENSRQYLVKLKPVAKGLQSYLKEIDIYLDKNEMSVARLVMHEPSGDFTKIDFSGTKINGIIKDDKFIIP